MKTQSTIILSVVIVCVVILFLGMQFIGTKEEVGTLNAEGRSELTFVPDNAKVYVGISITKPTAQDAQNYENKVINDIIKELKALGISEGDIETESISLYEDKVWTEKEMKSNGWRATQTLKVKTKDFSKIGKIVDVAIKNGANEINNVEFYLSQEKENEYKKQALSAATKSAKDKAQTIAEGLGKKLGKIRSVSETNYYSMPYNYMMKNSAGIDAVSESATIMPSDVTVSANIVVTYEIN